MVVANLESRNAEAAGMAKLGSRESLARCACRFGALLLISSVVVCASDAQVPADLAQASSNSAGIAPQATQALPSPVQVPSTQGNSADLPVRAAASLADTNRKALEAAAGKDAAKLLARSIPSQAMIYLDGKLVGNAPLLLFIPPGKHQVEMRGHNEEYGVRQIELSPNETEELALTLTLRYPASIAVHPEAASFSATNMLAVTGAALVSAPQAAEENSAQDPASAQISILAETNRKALAQGAGKDAAKLLLKSVPAEAMIFLDAVFVGRAPQLLTLSPGKHKVEMRGPHEEFGERLVGLLPNDTQQLTLTLAVRYPASISVR